MAVMSAHWERGWWRAGRQEMREERRMKMKEGKWDGERERGSESRVKGKKKERGHKTRGLLEKRDRMEEKKQFRRRDGKSRWFMHYIYSVNGVFSQFLPGWKHTPRWSHAFCYHLSWLPAQQWLYWSIRTFKCYRLHLYWLIHIVCHYLRLLRPQMEITQSQTMSQSI